MEENGTLTDRQLNAIKPPKARRIEVKVGDGLVLRVTASGAKTFGCWWRVPQSYGGAERKGFASFLQADVEFVQGMHLIGTGEVRNTGVRSPPASWGGWLSYAWFFAPHADLRFDTIYQSLGATSGSTSAITFLLQGHVYL